MSLPIPHEDVIISWISEEGKSATASSKNRFLNARLNGLRPPYAPGREGEGGGRGVRVGEREGGREGGREGEREGCWRTWRILGGEKHKTFCGFDCLACLRDIQFLWMMRGEGEGGREGGCEGGRGEGILNFYIYLFVFALFSSPCLLYSFTIVPCCRRAVC